MSRFNRRINPLNLPILKIFGREHPAVRALERHADARDACVGKEIEWPRYGNVAIDQQWFSKTDDKLWKFSAFAYMFISFDLVLDG